LEDAGRPKVFIPMLGNMYKLVFGEYTPKVETNIKERIKNTKPNEVLSKDTLEDIANKYEMFSDAQKNEFKALILKEGE
jgi:hypothetical protein